MNAPVSIPFHFVKPEIPLPMLHVHVNGIGPLECVLDTGNASYPLLISEGTAKRLGLDETKFKPVDGFVVGLTRAFRDGHVDSYEVGEIKRGKTKILIGGSMDQLQESLGVPIEANIGYKFFKDFVLTLDFRKNMLTLDRSPLGKGSFRFTLAPKAPVIVVEALSGGNAFNFILDTGASGTCISKEAAKSMKLKKGAETPLNHSGEMGYLTQIASLKVGNREQQNVDLIAADFVSHLSDEMGTKIDGVLGYNFWGKYQLSIDYLRKRTLFADPK